MARDWDNEIMTMVALDRRMAELEPRNTAPIPLSTSKELDDTGQWVWVVNIHVRIPGVTEYEVEGSSPSYTDALRRAYLGVNKYMTPVREPTIYRITA